MSPRGDAVVVLAQLSGLRGGPCARVRPVGGDWQPTTCVPGGAAPSDDPQVAVDAQGEATVVWERRVDADSTVIYVAGLSLATGMWSDPAVLSDVREHQRGPRLAVNAAGDAVVAWTNTTDTNAIVTSRAGAHGSWTSPRDFGFDLAVVETSNPSVAIAAHQAAVVVWEGRQRSGQGRIIRSRTRAGAGQTISDAGQDATNPAAAQSPDGRAVAAWQQQAGATTSVVRVAVRAPVSGLWQPSQDLDVGQDAQVATDAQGNATIAFAARAGIRVARIPSGSSTPLPAETIPGSSGGTLPRLAVNAAGAAVVVWKANTAHGAVRPAGSAGWSSGAISLNTATTPAVTIDAFGDALSTWTDHPIGVVSRVQAAAFDASGPQLNALEMPPSTHAGVPVTFAVAPLDVWSRVASTVWSFGDGASAAGTSVSHAFAAAGTYPVTVTSTDALGNTSSDARVIGVVGPPPPCGPDCDGDLYPASVDCDDNRAALHPGADDTPGDGVDQDCVDGGRDGPRSRQ